MSVTRAANRSYLPAVNSRLTFWKVSMPGNAQNRSMGPSTSSRPWMVSPSCSTGRCWAPASTSWVADSSRLDQASVLTCHRLLYAGAFGTVTHLRSAPRAAWVASYGRPVSHDAPSGRLRTRAHGECSPVCGSRPGTANRGLPGAPSAWQRSAQQRGDRAGADRPAAFPDGEAEPGLERGRLAQLDGHAHPVARRGHAVRPEVEHAHHVRGPDEELRTVARAHLGPAAALGGGQQVHAGREPLVRRQTARRGHHLAAPDLVAADAAEQQGRVVARLGALHRL